MPFKLHSKGRRHIPRRRHRVTNWREYGASLRNCGSLIIWFRPDANMTEAAPGERRESLNAAFQGGPVSIV